jgi:membrane fusion protein, multidrug efflux system
MSVAPKIHLMSTSIAIESSDLASHRESTIQPKAEFASPRTAATPARTASPRPIKPLFIALPIALLILAGIVTYFVRAAGYEETDNAFVEGRIHQVSTRVAGTVSEVLVGDFDTVKAGQPLLRLDARDADVAVREAQAGVAQADAGILQAEAALAQARATVQQAGANVAQAVAQMRKAQLDFNRANTLFAQPPGGTRVITQADFDNARASLDIATANDAAAAASRDAADAAVHAAEAGSSVAKARRETAAATLANAELQLSYTTIVAPVAGRLGKRGVEIGQRVSPGQALLGLVGDESWIIANFKEGQLSKMKAGQPVSLTIDAIKGHKFDGRVDSFSAGTGAKFALLPPDNATGNFTKIVQRVPVKIVLSAESMRGYESRLRPGLSADVEVAVK